MLDTRRSTWTTLRRHLGRRTPHRVRHPRSVAVVPATRSNLAAVVPLRAVLATRDTDGPIAPRRSLQARPMGGLNPADALSRALPH